MVELFDAGQYNYVPTNPIGRPVFATDGTGSKVWEATYLSFGGVHTTTGMPINLRFPGQWFQSETALHQNWMRDYDPTTGRYLQADPLGLVDGASIYGYALQSPGRYTDPTGEFIPILAGLALGMLADHLINKALENCGCGFDDSGLLPDNKYTALGGAYGGTGPFVRKPRTGAGGGGPSGDRTSVVSSQSPRSTGRFGRDFGRSLGRKLPMLAWHSAFVTGIDFGSVTVTGGDTFATIYF